MNRSKLTIEESLDKIKFMMNYDSLKTVTEQKLGEPVPAGVDPGYDPQEVYQAYINRSVRILQRNYDRINEIINDLQEKHFQGGPALDAVKAAYKASTGKDLPSESEQFATIQRPEPVKGPVDTPKTTATQWPSAKGTDESPYKYGTQGGGIAQVQQNMGLVEDGIWGQKTDAKIKELAPEFANGFTNQNLSQVIQKVRGQVNPTAVNTTNIKPSVNFTPAQNTAQLAGNTTKLASNPTKPRA